MDLDEQAYRVKFMARDRGSNCTAAFDAILADTGIWTCCKSGRCRRELLDRTLIWNENHLRRILRVFETNHHDSTSLAGRWTAAPLKPLHEPVDLDQRRVRRHHRGGGMINEYRLVA
jgi:hypothetical protein